MVKEYYSVFGLTPQFYLATRPNDYMGELATWDKAEKDLISALKKEKIETKKDKTKCTIIVNFCVQYC